jgi:mono/diheme cytochrome c family protein
MLRRLMVLVGMVGAVGAGTARGQDVAKGKEVYASATPKCKMCHSIGGEGNAKGSLDDAAKQTPADLKAWMRTPKEMATKAKADRKPAMPVYGPDKISDPDLDALVAYLSTLKQK